MPIERESTETASDIKPARLDDYSGIMFATSDGIMFYFHENDVVLHMDKENYIEINTAYIVTMSTVFDASRMPAPMAINLVNVVKDVKLFYGGIGNVPKNSSIIKSINEIQTGLKIL